MSSSPGPLKGPSTHCLHMLSTKCIDRLPLGVVKSERSFGIMFSSVGQKRYSTQ